MSELARLHLPDAPAPPTTRVEEAIAEGKVPVDKYGMPYLLHPGDASVNNGCDWDDDHSFFFSNSPELTDDAAGRALRISRVQHVPRWIHARKHEIFFRNGVEELPVLEAEKFALTVLACGGYASRTVIDVRGSEPKLVRVSDRMHDFIRGRQQLHAERKPNHTYGYRDTERSLREIGIFFADYIRRRNIGDVVTSSTIDEFLHTRDEAIRRKRGNFIIRQAIISATDNVEPRYQKALRKQVVRPRIRSARGVVATVFPITFWADYHEPLAKQLAA